MDNWSKYHQGSYSIIGSYAYLGYCPSKGSGPCIAYPVPADIVRYEGPELVNLGIDPKESLTVILQKIDEKFGSLLGELYGLTTTTTTTTINL